MIKINTKFDIEELPVATKIEKGRMALEISEFYLTWTFTLTAVLGVGATAKTLEIVEQKLNTD